MKGNWPLGSEKKSGLWEQAFGKMELENEIGFAKLIKISHLLSSMKRRVTS